MKCHAWRDLRQPLMSPIQTSSTAPRFRTHNATVQRRVALNASSGVACWASTARKNKSSLVSGSSIDTSNQPYPAASPCSISRSVSAQSELFVAHSPRSFLSKDATCSWPPRSSTCPNEMLLNSIDGCTPPPSRRRNASTPRNGILASKHLVTRLRAVGASNSIKQPLTTKTGRNPCSNSLAFILKPNSKSPLLAKL